LHDGIYSKYDAVCTCEALRRPRRSYLDDTDCAMIEEDELEIQEMIVEAGLTGDKELALQGFLLDPMIHDFDAGRQMFKELCQAQGLFQ